MIADVQRHSGKVMDMDIDSRPRSNVILKVLLDGLYDEECPLSRLRGCHHILRAIWAEVRRYWVAAIQLPCAAPEEEPRVRPRFRRDLHVSRLALTQAGLRPEQILEETQDVMLDGRSGVDSTASEVSWEALEDAETRPTLWVPDHAATSCMGCNTQFWFGRRKHHCR